MLHLPGLHHQHERSSAHMPDTQLCSPQVDNSQHLSSVFDSIAVARASGRRTVAERLGENGYGFTARTFARLILMRATAGAVIHQAAAAKKVYCILDQTTHMVAKWS